MNIKYDPEYVYEHQLREVIKDKDLWPIETVDDLVKYLYNPDSSYKVVRRWPETPKQTVVNRINELWVYPLFLLCYPIRYVMFGSAQVSADSKLGKSINWLVGVMK
jgi:hypothetical protein